MKAADIRVALRRHFAAPECAIVFEVAQATGFAASRHLDAVAMDLWPSRGLSLHGIEIKVSRGDWRREKNDPAKAEQIARFCDFFWIAAPRGIIPIEDLPIAWGHIEVDDAGRTGITKKAERTEAQPIGRPFIAALLRASGRDLDPDEADAAFAARVRASEETFGKRVADEAKRLTEFNVESASHWNALVRALGREPGHFWEDQHLIRAIQVVMASGVASSYGGLENLRQSLANAERQVAKALGELKIPEPLDPPGTLPKRLRLAQ